MNVCMYLHSLAADLDDLFLVDCLCVFEDYSIDLNQVKEYEQ